MRPGIYCPHVVKVPCRFYLHPVADEGRVAKCLMLDVPDWRRPPAAFSMCAIGNHRIPFRAFADGTCSLLRFAAAHLVTVPHGHIFHLAVFGALCMAASQGAISPTETGLHRFFFVPVIVRLLGEHENDFIAARASVLHRVGYAIWLVPDDLIPDYPNGSLRADGDSFWDQAQGFGPAEATDRRGAAKGIEFAAAAVASTPTAAVITVADVPE